MAGSEPDVVMACAGDVPTLETLAAVSILRERIPELSIRVVNVVDLMTLQPREEHPHGLPDRHFDDSFTTDRPVIFAYHSCLWLIHRLPYRRTNHKNLHVRGYKEQGTTTPFDMVVMHELDRYHLVADVVDRAPAAPTGRLREAACARPAHRPPRVYPPIRPGPAGGARVDMARSQGSTPGVPGRATARWRTDGLRTAGADAGLACRE